MKTYPLGDVLKDILAGSHGTQYTFQANNDNPSYAPLFGEPAYIVYAMNHTRLVFYFDKYAERGEEPDLNKAVCIGRVAVPDAYYTTDKPRSPETLEVWRVQGIVGLILEHQRELCDS